MKKLFAFLTAALFLVMSLNINALTAEAADPKTYYVKYYPDKKAWYYQPGNEWDEEVAGRELYYMTLEFQDGDYVVAEGYGDFPHLKLDFYLGNFTAVMNTALALECKGVKDCYILTNSAVSISAPVENAWVYQKAKANFNEDCYNLELIYDNGEPKMGVNVVGQCNYFYCHSENHTKYKLWNFTEPIKFEGGILHTGYWAYQVEPPANGVQTPSVAPTAAPAEQAPATQPAQTTPVQGVLDDVPKTGQSYNYIVALGFAALCLAGCYSLKRKF